MGQNLHVLRAEPLYHRGPNAKEHRIAGSQDADVVLVGGFDDAFERAG